MPHFYFGLLQHKIWTNICFCTEAVPILKYDSLGNMMSLDEYLNKLTFETDGVIISHKSYVNLLISAQRHALLEPNIYTFKTNRVCHF